MQFIYNITGVSVRLNPASDDGALSVIDIDPRAMFDSMRQEIMTSGEFGDRGEVLHDRIYDMEGAMGTPAYPRKYASFLSLAADHMDTFKPFLPALAQLLLAEPPPAEPRAAESPIPPDEATPA